MWFWGPKRLPAELNILDAHISPDDRYDLRLQELIISQQHFLFFRP